MATFFRFYVHLTWILLVAMHVQTCLHQLSCRKRILLTYWLTWQCKEINTICLTYLRKESFYWFYAKTKWWTIFWQISLPIKSNRDDSILFCKALPSLDSPCCRHVVNIPSSEWAENTRSDPKQKYSQSAARVVFGCFRHWQVLVLWKVCFLLV